ncbi:hypothetical protein Rs2_14874 [Raphanus sativus]|nr:hypothetical protein Rs2_14874 [Raphanus sativus]
MDSREERSRGGPLRTARIPRVNKKLDLHWISPESPPSILLRRSLVSTPVRTGGVRHANVPWMIHISGSGADEHIELSMWLRAFKAQGTTTQLSGARSTTEANSPSCGASCWGPAMPSQKREKPHPSLSFLRPPAATREGHGGVKGDPINLFRPRIISSWALGLKLCQNLNTQEALALPEKEVIQPHLPVRLPCYDFTPVTSPAFGTPPPCG